MKLPMPHPFSTLLLLALASAPTVAQADDGPGLAPYTPAQLPRVTPVVEVVRAVGPAVVNIYQEVVTEQPLPWPYNRMYPTRRKSTSLGSGVIIDADGFILTNAHVIQPNGEIQVQLGDGRNAVARLVNIDPTNDVALLKIRAEQPLPAAPLGTSSDVMVGENVIAIGNPLGNASTVTAGIVSSLFRDVRLPEGGGERFRDIIQIDAPINPGNSGGPLLNMRGEVIGINWAIAREAEGIGFAIPIDRVRHSLIDTLLNPQLHKNVATGMEFEGDAKGHAVALSTVLPGGAADRAGLRVGDELLTIDDAPIDWEFDVAKALYRADPGDEVRLLVRRDGEQLPFAFRLEEQESPLQHIAQALGVRVVDHPNFFGVLVDTVDPTGPAARLPLERGDLIDGLDGRQVNGMQDLWSALQRAHPGDRVSINLFRGGQAMRGRITLR